MPTPSAASDHGTYTRAGYGLLREVGNLARQQGALAGGELLAEAVRTWRAWLASNAEADRLAALQRTVATLKAAGALLEKLPEGDPLAPLAREWRLYRKHHPELMGATREQQLTARIRPLPRPAFEADVPWHGLSDALDNYARNWGGCELQADFHGSSSWSREYKAAFIESAYRGTAGNLVLTFNHPHWQLEQPTDLPAQMLLVDGRQRLNAVLEFIDGRFPVFGDETASTLRGSRYDPLRPGFRFHIAIHSLPRRRDVLQLYLDLNGAGASRPANDLERVRTLLRAAAA